MAPNRWRTALVAGMLVAVAAAVAAFVGLPGHQPTAANSAPPVTVPSISRPVTARRLSSRPAPVPTTRPRRAPTHQAEVNHRVVKVKHPTKPAKHVAARHQPPPVRQTKLTALPTPPTRTWTVQANSQATVYAQPGSRPLVSITPTSAMGALWMPVYRVRGAWEEIGLPGPPNGMKGWIQRADVHQKLTHWSVVVSISRRTETIYNDGRQLAEAPVAVGAPGTPTPTGHTFIDGDVPTVGQFAVESPDVEVGGRVVSPSTRRGRRNVARRLAGQRTDAVRVRRHRPGQVEPMGRRKQPLQTEPEHRRLLRGDFGR